MVEDLSFFPFPLPLHHPLRLCLGPWHPRKVSPMSGLVKNVLYLYSTACSDSQTWSSKVVYMKIANAPLHRTEGTYHSCEDAYISLIPKFTTFNREEELAHSGLHCRRGSTFVRVTVLAATTAREARST